MWIRPLALALFILRTACAATLDPAKIDELAEKSMRAWGVPGVAIAIVEGDKVIYAKGYGVKELGKTDPVTAGTIFAIGSTTKAFTTAAMAMLVDEGKMGWDDPVRSYVEFFHLNDPMADAMVTLRDLVSHRTGLSRNDLLWYNSLSTRAEIIRKVAFVKPSRQFRSAWQYQNIMFLTAGYAVGRASGGSWEQFVQRRILDPLAMTDADFSADVARTTPNHATPHRKNVTGKPEVIEWRNIDNIGPAGSLNASVNDMAKWIRLQLNDGVFDGKRLISHSAFEEMRTPQMAIRPEDAGRNTNSESNEISYGLGWFLQDYRGLFLVQHGGAIDGFRTSVALVPKQKLGVVVMSNLDNENMPEALRYQIIDAVLGLPAHDWDAELIAYFGKQEAAGRASLDRFLASRQKGTKPSLPLHAYAGTYEDRGYGELKIAVVGKNLESHWSRVNSRLEHFHYDTFLMEDKSPLIFRLGPDANVESVTMLGIEFIKKR